MNPLISIPREALAELLRSTGSAMTPEQFVASLPTANTKYASRARASNWSKIILAAAAIVSVLLLPFDFDVEDLIVAVGICTVTYFEFRTNRYFREVNPAAPALGFCNQSLFAAGLLIYGLYHALVPASTAIPAEYRDLIDPAAASSMQVVIRIGYLTIGVVGGISQFCLAWYYRNAR